MERYVMRLRSRYKKDVQDNQKSGLQKKKYAKELFENLQENLNNLKDMLDEPEDLVIRRLSVAGKDCAVAYIDGMVDDYLLHSYIMQDLQRGAEEQQDMPEESVALLQKIEEDVLSATDIERGKTMTDVSEAILLGETVVYVDGV